MLLPSMVDVLFRHDVAISAAKFVDILRRSGLAERRPVEDLSCIEGMLRYANLTATAWRGDMLIGVARSMTDFHYACYLSDLAVDRDYQRAGIGTALQDYTQRQLGPRCKLIVRAAPSADAYYEKIGFDRDGRCFVLPRDRALGSQKRA